MSWAGIGSPSAPFIGEGFTEEQRNSLLAALTGPVFLSHPKSNRRWVIRVNAAGSLEFLAAQGDRSYSVVGTLTTAGVWSTAGAQNPAVGLADPGR